jgi:FMNH2-dependent dimethyl sulfone monooxygenase
LNGRACATLSVALVDSVLLEKKRWAKCQISANKIAEGGTRVRQISGNRFKLGMFCANVSGGITKTIAPDRWVNSWENNYKLALLSEEAGIDFLLPLANWYGLGGEAPSEGDTLEAITWATGLLARTQAITIFTTIHAPFMHPVFAAKQVVTADHIGCGRLGLNVVSGSVPEEFSLFGVPMLPHDERYAVTEEWLAIVKRLWSEDEPFDFDGKYFHLKHAAGKPKPWGDARPLIISAGSSPTGRAFARRNADCLFMLVVDLDKLPAEIKAIRAGAERNFGIYASGHMFCKKTHKETNEYYQYLVHENGDWPAAEFLIRMHHANGAIPTEKIPLLRERFVSGTGTFLVKGDPDDVAQQYMQMAEAGLDGIAVALPNFLDDFAVVRDEVLPRLERLGLRTPVRVTATA